MHTLMRKIALWRPILYQRSCHFCSAGSSPAALDLGTGQLHDTKPQAKKKTTKECAIRIDATHRKLRNALREGEDFEEVWSKHSQDTSDLSEYASAMVNMARQWENQVLTKKGRNTWIATEVRRYYYYYARRNMISLQEEVRTVKLDPDLLTPSHQEIIERLQPNINAFLKHETREDLHELLAGHNKTFRQPGIGREGPETVSGGSPVPGAWVYSEDSSGIGQLHATSRVRVLDVGSCYNPLAQFPDLHVTPLDLMPATPDVYKCDFINVKIADASECSELLEEEGSRADRRIDCLPRNYYDVVVFSLVLDYIPCPEARLQCCRKAYQLLRPGGLMLVITPLGTGVLGSLFFKWMQLHLARLGFNRLRSFKNEKHRAFSYRKAFFPLSCIKTEAMDVEIEVVNLERQLRNVKYKEMFERVNLNKGLYFTRDVKVDK